MKLLALAALIVTFHAEAYAEADRLVRTCRLSDTGKSVSVYLSSDRTEARVEIAGRDYPVKDFQLGETCRYDIDTEIGPERLVFRMDGRHEIQKLAANGDYVKAGELDCVPGLRPL